VELLETEFVLGSLLPVETWEGPWLQTSESVLRSRLSGEAPWVPFTPVGDGPVKDEPHLADDSVALLWNKSYSRVAPREVTN
jgi:hypothetical protein